MISIWRVLWRKKHTTGWQLQNGFVKNHVWGYHSSYDNEQKIPQNDTWNPMFPIAIQ